MNNETMNASLAFLTTNSELNQSNILTSQIHSSIFTTTASLTTTTSNFTIDLQPFTNTEIAICAAIIFTFLAVGLTANCLTISVISCYECLRSNVFMRFILSLCVSDLLSALISWLFLYRRTWGFDSWSPLPNIFCKFYWAADFMTSYVTAMHILSFATLRLISMKYPIFFNKMKMKYAHIWIAMVWFVGFIGGFIPAWLMFGATTPDRENGGPNARFPACTVLQSAVDQYRLFQNITFPIFLYIPTVGVVTICAVLIALVRIRSKKIPASKKQEKKRKKEKQALIQLSLIICAFLIGYIPFTAYEFWSIQDFPVSQQVFDADNWFGMIEYLFLRFSECLNPLFYNLGSAKMRRFTKKFLKEKVFRNCIKVKLSSQPSRGGFSATTSTNAM